MKFTKMTVCWSSYTEREGDSGKNPRKKRLGTGPKMANDRSPCIWQTVGSSTERRQIWNIAYSVMYTLQC